MCEDSRGMPWGTTESMYYVEPEDEARGRQWYRVAGDTLNGWTTDSGRYLGYLDHLYNEQFPERDALTGETCQGIAYAVVHDEKGVQCDVDWPRLLTRVEEWASEKLGGSGPPPPPEKALYFDDIINQTYLTILGRPGKDDPAALAAYNPFFRTCVPERGLPACIGALQVVLFESPEYLQKNFR